MALEKAGGLNATGELASYLTLDVTCTMYHNGQPLRNTVIYLNARIPIEDLLARLASTSRARVR